MTPEEVLEFAQENEVEFVDLRCTPIDGVTAHVTLPTTELTLALFRDGYFRDTCGPAEPRLLVPATETAFLDPFFQHPTLTLLCDVRDPATKADDPHDARGVARRAQAALNTTAPADRALLAAELQFFVFDQVSFDQSMNAAHYRVESREGAWRRGQDSADNLGTQLRAGEAAHPLPPADSLHNLRSEMVAALTACGVACRAHQHGAATGGQMQITLAPAPLVQFADRLTICKYIIRNVAARHGKVATFMPQPLHGERGSGLPVRMTLWKGEPPPAHSAAGDSTEIARGALRGWQHHAASLLALACPTTNSYKRLVAGADTSWQPTHSPSNVPGQTDWIEWHAPDPSCNPYMAGSALLLAALDGIQTAAGSSATPAQTRATSLEAALHALEADHQYLLRAGVFSEEVLRERLRNKLAHDVQPLRERPHPYEFCLYFDV
jgi:glutamine synthetase